MRHLFWLAALLLLLPWRAGAEDLPTLLPPSGLTAYELVEVLDGDTIKVDIDGAEEKVRIIGVDTPELHHPNKPVQPFALAARDFVTDLIADQQVYLEIDQGARLKRDRYGRILAHVWTADSHQLVAAETIREGYGFYLSKYPFRQEYMDAFSGYEMEAREANRGLWGDGQ